MRFAKLTIYMKFIFWIKWFITIELVLNQKFYVLNTYSANESHEQAEHSRS